MSHTTKVRYLAKQVHGGLAHLIVRLDDSSHADVGATAVATRSSSTPSDPWLGLNRSRGSPRGRRRLLAAVVHDAGPHDAQAAGHESGVDQQHHSCAQQAL